MALGAAGAGFVGCRNAASPAVDAASVAPSVALGSAATAQGADAASTAAPPPSSVQVDLLHAVASVVAVSSKVDNPHDFPEHLVDGKTETAWNSRTGDLHGFIAFRTPATTRVQRIELTVGFDKRSPRGDLFTMNHRISRVRVSREGVTLREVDLNSEERGLQGIDVDAPGGDFRVDVLATVPGSQKAWRELTVSELRVLGLPGDAPANPTHLPAMAIGSLDGVPPHPTPPRGAPKAGPFPTLAALCAAYDKVMAPLIDAAFPGDRYPGKITGPHCAPARQPPAAQVASTVAKGPFRSGAFVVVNDVAEESARLVLETERGFTLTSVTLWSRFHDDPGCGHAGDHSLEDGALARTSMGRDVLLLRVLATDVYWLGAIDPGGTVEYAHACSVDDSGAAVCEGPRVVGRAAGWPPGWDLALEKFAPVDASKLRWASRLTPALGPSGDLRAVP